MRDVTPSLARWVGEISCWYGRQHGPGDLIDCPESAEAFKWATNTSVDLSLYPAVTITWHSILHTNGSKYNEGEYHTVVSGALPAFMENRIIHEAERKYARIRLDQEKVNNDRIRADFLDNIAGIKVDGPSSQEKP